MMWSRIGKAPWWVGGMFCPVVATLSRRTTTPAFDTRQITASASDATRGRELVPGLASAGGIHRLGCCESTPSYSTRLDGLKLPRFGGRFAAYAATSDWYFLS